VTGHYNTEPCLTLGQKQDSTAGIEKENPTGIKIVAFIADIT
jgi:hypothetical protein